MEFLPQNAAWNGQFSCFVSIPCAEIQSQNETCTRILGKTPRFVSKGLYTEPLLGNIQQKCLLPEQQFHWESDAGEIFANLHTHWLFHTSPGQRSQLALEAALCPLRRSSGNPANCLLMEEGQISVVQTQKKPQTNKIQMIITMGGGEPHKMTGFSIPYGYSAFSWGW